MLGKYSSKWYGRIFNIICNFQSFLLRHELKQAWWLVEHVYPEDYVRISEWTHLSSTLNWDRCRNRRGVRAEQICAWSFPAACWSP